MPTLDLTREHKRLYGASADKVELVEVPPLRFLMIDGEGDPNRAPAYAEALQALYGLAYGLKFALKRLDPGLDFKVAPLEGLWWAHDMEWFSLQRRDDWRWTMMIAQPDSVTSALLADVAPAVERKKGPAVRRVRLESYDEGLSAQVLHLGPYAAEAPTIDRLHAYIAERGYRRSGKHHEIYLGDPSRSAPEKLKTIIRQPVAKG